MAQLRDTPGDQERRDGSNGVEFVISAKPHVFIAEGLLEPRDFLYGSHIQRGTVSLSAGLGAVGKSSKSIVEVLAMTSVKPLLGIRPSKPLRALLINLEDNRPELDRRIAAVMKYYGLTPAEVGNRLITIAKGELTFKIARQVRMGEIAPDEAVINGMIKYLLENAIDVVSIDPLRKTHRVSENDNTAMGEVIECFERIAETANCAAHIWHHNRKSNSGETTVDSARGAVALIDAPRSVELLETMTTEMADKFGIRSERRRYYSRTFNGKVNFAPPIEEFDVVRDAKPHPRQRRQRWGRDPLRAARRQRLPHAGGYRGDRNCRQQG